MEKQDLHSEPIIIETQEEDGTYTEFQGKPLYYTVRNVAEILGETESTIRHWCVELENELNIERSGRNRMFKETDIDKLRHIQELLRVQGFKIRQVREYLQKSDKNVLVSTPKEKEQLIIDAIAENFVDQLGEALYKMESVIIDEVTESIKANMMDNFNKAVNDVRREIWAVAKVESEKVAEKIAKEIIEREQSKKKGFFARWFGKWH